MIIAKRYAEVEWTGDPQSGIGKLSGESSALRQLPISSPGRMGPVGEQTSPEELLAGAHAGCYVMAFSFFLSQTGKTVEGLKVKATYALDMTDNVFKITTAQL